MPALPPTPPSPPKPQPVPFFQLGFTQPQPSTYVPTPGRPQIQPFSVNTNPVPPPQYPVPPILSPSQQEALAYRAREAEPALPPSTQAQAHPYSPAPSYSDHGHGDGGYLDEKHDLSNFNFPQPPPATAQAAGAHATGDKMFVNTLAYDARPPSDDFTSFSVMEKEKK